MDEQTKNLILATALSFLVLLTWMFLFPPAPIPENNGINENEVKLIPKNTKNKGFFEKFFQLFS